MLISRGRLWHEYVRVDEFGALSKDFRAAKLRIFDDFRVSDVPVHPLLATRSKLGTASGFQAANEVTRLHIFSGLHFIQVAQGNCHRNPTRGTLGDPSPHPDRCACQPNRPVRSNTNAASCCQTPSWFQNPDSPPSTGRDCEKNALLASCSRSICASSFMNREYALFDVTRMLPFLFAFIGKPQTLINVGLAARLRRRVSIVRYCISLHSTH